MPTLPSGQVVGITSERARYHAVRQSLRINKNTPHQDLYRLVDIIFTNSSGDSNPSHSEYHFTGFTISDTQWLNKWKSEDRDSFLSWITEGSGFHEIEGARNKVIYDTLPHTIQSFDYPQRLYSTLQRRIAAMSMASSSVTQWRNTILNMRHCGVREEEIKWSGVLNFLDEAESVGHNTITRKELLTRIDFGRIHLELSNELVREKGCHLHFEDKAEILSPEQYLRTGLSLGLDEYAVSRCSDSLLNYRIAYIRLQRRGSLYARRWVVLDPFDRALTNDGDNSVIFHPDMTTAKDAAGVHAQTHYGVKSPLRPSNKYEYMGLYGGEGYREWILTLPDYRESYFTPHFTERNVLLHIRTKQRHDNQGNRLLFIEEIQSDWHQQHTRRKRASHFNNKIPDAPFQKEWTLLAIKLVLQHAIEEGYDGIAWTPGIVQQKQFQCEMEWLLRLYDKVIPQHLVQLSRDWAGTIEKCLVMTKDPWLAPRRKGDYWSVRDKEGKFTTLNRLSKSQAIAISNRHSRAVNIEVPVFYIPDAMRSMIQGDDALPLFGEVLVDRVKKPLCGNSEFTTCDARTMQTCMSG